MATCNYILTLVHSKGLTKYRLYRYCCSILLKIDREHFHSIEYNSCSIDYFDLISMLLNKNTIIKIVYTNFYSVQYWLIILFQIVVRKTDRNRTNFIVDICCVRDKIQTYSIWALYY